MCQKEDWWPEEREKLTLYQGRKPCAQGLISSLKMRKMLHYQPILFFFLLIYAGTTLNAQQKQQKIIGRLMTEQKEWNQRQMPSNSFFNNSKYEYRTSLYRQEQIELNRQKPKPVSIHFPRPVVSRYLLQRKENMQLNKRETVPPTLLRSNWNPIHTTPAVMIIRFEVLRLYGLRS